MTGTKLKDLIPISVAAKRIHMDRTRARDIAIRHGVAVKWGGSEKRPTLKVTLEDLEQAVLKERFIPPAKAEAPGRRQSQGKLHRHVTCG